MRPHTTFRWLGSWVALLLLSALTAEGVHFTSPDADPGTMQVTMALCSSWLAILMTPAATGDGYRPGVMVLWSILAAAGFVLLSYLPDYAVPGDVRFRLAGGIVMLVLLFGALHRLIRGFTADPASAKALFALVTGLFLAAPLYLGVIAELFSARVFIADFIIAASPLSYLAGIAEFDYLRSSWFYQHAPFGGLRFNYPGPGAMTVGYLVITLAIMSMNILVQKPQTRAPYQ